LSGLYDFSLFMKLLLSDSILVYSFPNTIVANSAIIAIRILVGLPELVTV
jgi:hypothetical protein